MNNNFHNKTLVLASLLGLIIGVLLSLISMKVSYNNRIKASAQSWSKLNLLLGAVQDNYVDSVDVSLLTDAALSAALAKLDPHSVYLPPADLKESVTALEGNFDGIGIQFNVPNDTAIVLEVIAGGPSEKAGLQVGDRILKVGEQDIAGVKFPQDSMVRRMKGPAGTRVGILVQRGEEKIPFEITRGKIPVHSVDAAFMIDDITGYLRLSKFSRTTYSEVMKAVAELYDKGMDHLIFDLRDNSGGYLDQALSLSDMFLEQGDEIVSLKGRNRKSEVYKADGKGLYQRLDLSVLINESSASSSEIFAGAIQDNDRGVIVGRRSFGKGLVQEPFNLTDGSGIRLTVARYYTPSGRCIQKPYSDDYGYDIYRRYAEGEMFDRDSIKIDSTKAFRTRAGRTVYGGGGIIPDIFVPLDTTKATKYYIACNKKAVQMRYASSVFDRYRSRLTEIDDFAELDRFLDSIDIPSGFRSFARATEGLVAGEGEWKETEPYIIPQLRALVGRYSKLGENAFYKLYLPVDDVVQYALKSPSKVKDL